MHTRPSGWGLCCDWPSRVVALEAFAALSALAPPMTKPLQIDMPRRFAGARARNGRPRQRAPLSQDGHGNYPLQRREGAPSHVAHRGRRSRRCPRTPDHLLDLLLDLHFLLLLLPRPPPLVVFFVGSFFSASRRERVALMDMPSDAMDDRLVSTSDIRLVSDSCCGFLCDSDIHEKHIANHTTNSLYKKH